MRMNDVDNVDVDVYGAVYRAVDGTAYGAVGGAVYWAVHGAAVGPVNEPLYYNIRTIINQITETE